MPIRPYLQTLIDTYHLDDIVRDFSRMAPQILESLSGIYICCFGDKLIDGKYLTDSLKLLIKNHDKLRASFVDIYDDDIKTMIMDYLSSQILEIGREASAKKFA